MTIAKAWRVDIGFYGGYIKIIDFIFYTVSETTLIKSVCMNYMEIVTVNLQYQGAINLSAK